MTRDEILTEVERIADNLDRDLDTGKDRQYIAEEVLAALRTLVGAP